MKTLNQALAAQSWISGVPSQADITNELMGGMPDPQGMVMQGIDFTSVPVNNSSIGGIEIQPNQSTLRTESLDFKLDRDWVKQAFLVDGLSLGDLGDPLMGTTDAANRWTSTAEHKFVDTRLGGALGINARPQFTPYADIPVKGRLTGRKDVSVASLTGNNGMGRYYSEAIDDNAQTIYLRFGVPQFNSISRFISGAFDPDLATLTRTGRASNILYDAASIVGAVGTTVLFPALSLALFGTKILGMFFRSSNSKFYTLKPTMHLYWGAVNNLVNTIGVNMGILPQIVAGSKQEDQRIGTTYNTDQTMLNNLYALMPEVFSDGKGFDMFVMATKAQRVANKLALDEYDNFNQGTSTDFTGYVKKSYKDKVAMPPGETGGSLNGIANFINTHLLFQYYQSPPASDNKTTVESTPEVDKDGNIVSPDDPGFWKSYFQCVDAESRQGADFAIFKVDGTGSVSESFGNTTVESDLAQKINGMSSTAREGRFTFADGNLSDEGVSGMVQAAMGGVVDVASGLLNGATFGAFGAMRILAGEGMMDIPKHWQSSSATLPRSSYTMQLISPYGNVISQMQNIYIPLAMILAGAMPLSTGKQSYTSPFLVQLYDRGRCQVQLGIIESVSITRGTSNLPFTSKGKALAIDVTFNIADLSSIMHMPLPKGNLFGAMTETDPDNILMDYLSVLAGQDIYSQIYKWPKAKLALANKIRRVSELSSPGYWASLTNSYTAGFFGMGMLNGGANVLVNPGS